ncbi:cupin domain-containing protein [halophilic archaeon]|nr:cupin domain-containing protein [halophilic archaeon]
MKRTQASSDRWFDVVLTNDDAQAAVMTLDPGESTGGPDNYHADSDQWCYVVDGEGRATVDDRDIALAAGDLILIEAGETHEIECTGERALETLNLYVPPEY